MTENKKSERGFALVFTIISMMLTSIMCTLLVSYTMYTYKLVTLQERNVKSNWLVDSIADDFMTNYDDYVFGAETQLSKEDELFYKAVRVTDGNTTQYTLYVYTVKRSFDEIVETEDGLQTDLTTTTEIKLTLVFNVTELYEDGVHVGTEKNICKYAYTDTDDVLTRGENYKSQYFQPVKTVIDTVSVRTINYDLNYEFAPAMEKQVVENDTAVLASAPKRSGYVFMGWCTDSECLGECYAAGSELTEHVGFAYTLYAKWIVEAHDVIYDVNGGNLNSAPFTQQKLYGQQLIITQIRPTRDGLVFKEWNTMPDGTGNIFHSGEILEADIVEDLNLYAIWSTGIMYDANGGVQTPVYDVKTPGESLFLPTNMYRKGWYFAGWDEFRNSSVPEYPVGSAFTDDDRLAETSITLYAVWYRTISFESDVECNLPQAVVQQPDDYITLPVAATREGYDFVCWNTESDGTGESYAAGETLSRFIGEPMTLYPIWSCRISFNLNGNAGTTPEPMYKNSGVSQITLPQADEKTDYVFGGWCVASDGTDAVYAGGSVYDAEIDSHVTLYAVYYPLVKFNSRCDTVSPEPEPKVIGTDLLLPDALTRPGYTFNSWNTSPDGTGINYIGGANMSFEPEGSITFYAIWNSFVHYDLNYDGAPALESTTQLADGYVISYPPVRDGFRFLCWNTSPDGSGTDFLAGAYSIDYGESYTLYAVWQQID